MGAGPLTRCAFDAFAHTLGDECSDLRSTKAGRIEEDITIGRDHFGARRECDEAFERLEDRSHRRLDEQRGLDEFASTRVS